MVVVEEEVTESELPAAKVAREKHCGYKQATARRQAPAAAAARAVAAAGRHLARPVMAAHTAVAVGVGAQVGARVHLAAPAVKESL